MVALARRRVVRHDLPSMHGIVLECLQDAQHHRTTRVLLESLCEEARATIRHLLHSGVPEQVDLATAAAGDLYEQASGLLLSSTQRADAALLMRRACRAMQARHGIDVVPLSHLLHLGRFAARCPRLPRCTEAHLEVLAAPISRLLLHLFG